MGKRRIRRLEQRLDAVSARLETLENTARHEPPSSAAPRDVSPGHPAGVLNAGPTVAGRYLDLLARCLTRTLHNDDGSLQVSPELGGGADIVDPAIRAQGGDWPEFAETMIGAFRMDNIRTLVETVLRENIPGDLIETGVWRGGASIFMRGILAAYGDTERTVWVADSFRGLPPPDKNRFPRDENDNLHTYAQLAVSLDQVRANFDRYGLLDEQVRFLPGWFRDTLPTAPVERLALLRLDGDMYESTIIALESLYPKLSPGGFVIVDDFSLPNCRIAIEEYREQHRISAPLELVDWTGRWWRKGVDQTI